MSRTLLALATAGLGSLFATGLHGQVPAPLTPGQTVRITDGAGQHRTGVLLSVSSDSRTIEIKDGLGRWTYALANLSTIEVRTGTYISPRTFVIAVGVTTVAGGVLGFLILGLCNEGFSCLASPAEAFAYGALAGAAVGLPVGLVLWPIIRYGRWEPAAMPSSHPRVGLGLAFKIPLPSW